MRPEFKAYEGWVGRWVGAGETLKNVPATVTLDIQPALDGAFLAFSVQSRHPNTGALLQGVESLLTVDPDGWLRLCVASTLHGSMVMPVTPEDPGALAVEGRSVTGNHVVVSLIQEGDSLMLTSYWRSPTPGAEPIGFSNYRMQRAKGAAGSKAKAKPAKRAKKSAAGKRR